MLKKLKIAGELQKKKQEESSPLMFRVIEMQGKGLISLSSEIVKRVWFWLVAYLENKNIEINFNGI